MFYIVGMRDQLFKPTPKHSLAWTLRIAHSVDSVVARMFCYKTRIAHYYCESRANLVSLVLWSAQFHLYAASPHGGDLQLEM